MRFLISVFVGWEEDDVDVKGDDRIDGNPSTRDSVRCKSLNLCALKQTRRVKPQGLCTDFSGSPIVSLNMYWDSGWSCNL